MNTLNLLSFLKRVRWYGHDTAGGSGGCGFVRWVRGALKGGALLLLFGFVCACLSLPASAETLFTDQTTPPVLPDVCDENPTPPPSCVPYELGMKFQSAVDGTISAIRYWKAQGELDDNPHIGHIWDASGNPLAAVTFTGETASGWQQQALDTPLPIQSGTIYVVSVNINFHYVATVGGLAVSVVNGDLSSVADGQNGVFGNPGGFPEQFVPANSTNYFRDIVFTPVQHSLSVTRDGSCLGNVISTPAGINCGIACSFLYNKGTQVQLTETADPLDPHYSAFTAWFGDCGGNGQTCDLTMDGERNVTATFMCLPVRIAGVSGYANIQDAYEAASDDATIQIQAGDFFEFAEDLSFGKSDVSVTVKGGYDEEFGSQPGFTTVIGTLTISGGPVTVEKLILM